MSQNDFSHILACPGPTPEVSSSSKLPVYKGGENDDNKRRRVLKPADQMACKSLNPIGMSRMFDALPEVSLFVCEKSLGSDLVRECCVRTRCHQCHGFGFSGFSRVQMCSG